MTAATPAEQDAFDAAIEAMDEYGIDPVGMTVREILAYGAWAAAPTAVEALATTVAVIRLELKRMYVTDGLPVPELTGNMLLVEQYGAVWFEVKTAEDLLYWVTADMAMRAEMGELLVAAESRDEALAYDESN